VNADELERELEQAAVDAMRARLAYEQACRACDAAGAVRSRTYDDKDQTEKRLARLIINVAKRDSEPAAALAARGGES